MDASVVKVEKEEYIIKREEEHIVTLALSPDNPIQEFLLDNHQRYIVVPLEIFASDFVALLGPRLHEHMKRRYTRIGPYQGSTKIWTTLATVLFRGGDTRRFETMEEIRQFLGKWARKDFERGSWAEISPPLTLKWDRKKDMVKFSFDYVVFATGGVRQTDGRDYQPAAAPPL
jgi:hypothetical protein